MMKEGLGTVAFLVFLIFSAADDPPEWLLRGLYAIGYNVSYDDVTIDHRPNGCSFLDAPIGAKGCGWSVQAYSGGYQVSPDQNYKVTSLHIYWKGPRVVGSNK
jgi:hypothetical protein